MTITSGQIFNAVSIATSATSETVSMVDRLSVGIILESASGARGGTITVQGKIGGSSWHTLSFFDSTGTIVSSIAVTAGVAFNADIQLSNINYDALRVVFTDSASGAGTLNGWVDRGGRDN